MASLTSSPRLSSKPVVNREYNTFAKGIITEASPLTFPEDASLDEQNFVLNNDKSRQRRFGIEYEDQGELITNGNFTEGNLEGWATSDFRWNNILGSPDLSILVVQVGNKIYLFDFTKDNPTAFPLNVDTGTGEQVPITLGADNFTRAQYTSINGTLVISIGDAVVYQITYDGPTDTATVESRALKVRDIWGVDDGLRNDERPDATVGLSDTHEYNLMNQGWPRSTSVAIDPGGDGAPAIGADTIAATFTSLGVYPSNGDVWQFGKLAGAEDPASLGAYNGTALDKFPSANFKAPKGKFIIELFSRGNSRETEADDLFEANTIGAGSLPSDITTGGIRSVASFAGRLFYSLFEESIAESDAESPRFDGSIVFTRIVRNGEDLIRCHSDNDPTSESFPDLLDSDGGYLTIPEASDIIKVVSTGRSLVIFAANGVWQLTGGNDNQFSAGNFFINKISNVGTPGVDSIVEAEGLIFYWGEGGIYMLQPNQLGDLSVQNRSEATIQTLYNAIPSAGQALARGAYDPSLKIVRWLYNDSPVEEYDGSIFRFRYTKELVFDIQLSAFYKNVFGNLTDGPYVSSVIISPNFSSLENTLQIVASNGSPIDVTADSGVNNVVTTENALTSTLSQTKYLTFEPSVGDWSFTYSLYRQTDFIDWFEFNSVGVDAPAFLETGYEILQDTQRRKQSKYITMNFRRTETGFEIDSGTGNLVATDASSCLVQARWDYADTINSGKFGSTFQAYRLNRNYIPSGTLDPFDYGLRVITTKSKLRGRGRSLYLRMDSEPTKAMHIYGWAIEFTAGASV